MELSETHLTAQTDSPGPPLGKAVAIARQDKALRCLVHVILRRPYEKALAVYIRDSTSLVSPTPLSESAPIFFLISTNFRIVHQPSGDQSSVCRVSTGPPCVDC